MQDYSFKIPLLPEAALNAIPEKHLDVPYAALSASQILDLYLPEGPGPFPLIVHFHGGAFALGTKRDVNLIPMLRGLARGYAVASVEYRLSGEARFPALIYDAKAAIRFLRANAAKYRLDPARFAAWGPSAGGYIAAMLGATSGNPSFEDLTMGNESASSAVQAAVDWCGPAGDFCRMDEEIRANGVGQPDHDDPDSPEARLLGCAIQKVKELSRLASPCAHVTPSVPPFLIHHGEADPVVPVQQSRTLAAAIAAQAGPQRVRLVTFPGRGHHGEPWFDEPAISDAVFGFLDGVFGR
jgi:acetyl esterase/lipase